MEPSPTSTCYSLQPQNQARQSNVADSEKWPCKVCTYLNWPRSLRCIQCCTKRGGEAVERASSHKDHDNEADADRAGEALQAMRISGSDTELAGSKPTQLLIGATASNRLTLSPSIDDATHLNNLTNASHNQLQSQNQLSVNQQQQHHHPPQQRDALSTVSPQKKPCFASKWACNVCYSNHRRHLGITMFHFHCSPAPMRTGRGASSVRCAGKQGSAKSLGHRPTCMPLPA